MHLKLQLNFLYSILISGLLFTGGQSFSNAQETAPKKAEVNGPQIPADEENHDTKDLEQLLKRYNTNSKKVLEDSSKLHGPQDEQTTEVKDSDIEEMRPSEDPMKNGTTNSLKKVKEDMNNRLKPENTGPNEFSSSVRLALEPMQRFSEKELLKRLDESTKDSPMRPYMQQFPDISIFAVRLIKDKDSIPSVVKIMEDRDRLIRFAGVMLFTIVFGMILKKIMHKEGRSFIKAAIYFLLRAYLLFAIRIGVVYYFFSTELTPAAKIFKQTFM
ncbi:MAG: hypothetical protein H7336_03040 [Bacteriovorax sp.]|nr:hypothetical protein [Bacteriovorax sp.]